MTIYDDLLQRRDNLNAPALLGAQQLSFGDLLDAVNQFAALLKRLGAQPGDRIAANLPNGLANIVVHLCSQACGMVFVPIAPKNPAPEQLHVLENASCRFYCASAADVALMAEAGFTQVAAQGDWVLFGREMPHSPEVAMNGGLIIHTSGSTGRPKGVVLSQSAISANVIAVADYLSLNGKDRSVVYTPPSYSYALSHLLTMLWAGGAILPWSDGLMDAHGLLTACGESDTTVLPTNGSILRVLLGVLDEAPIDFPHLRAVLFAGQPLSTELARSAQRRFPKARVVNMYGCTENAPRVSYKYFEDGGEDADVILPVGKPVAGTEIAILGDQDEALSTGETGHVCIRGTSLMSGYFGQPDAMAQRMRGGFYDTGDLGFLDAQGDLNITGRADNIILVGHEKVSPEEIEELVLALDEVVEVAVTGLADDRLYQAAVMLVVGTVPLKEFLPKLRRHISGSLSRAKMPRQFLNVEAIPRTAYGKIDRVAVRALAQKLIG